MPNLKKPESIELKPHKGGEVSYSYTLLDFLRQVRLVIQFSWRRVSKVVLWAIIALAFVAIGTCISLYLPIEPYGN